MKTKMPAQVGLAALVLGGCAIDEEARSATSALGCTSFVPGMVITSSATLCEGVSEVTLAEGKAAVTIDGDDVTLTCKGHVIAGTSSFGADRKPPTVGIRVNARKNVTIDGCAASGFRYGLIADGASALTLRDVDFSDNFTDPTKDWVQDDVQGGGVRLENVRGALVTRAKLARNWNGIEVRRSRGVKVSQALADHASNWGAFVDRSEDTEIADSNFDWGIRFGSRGPVREIPPEERDRTNWFGIDTKDSGGIVVDGGSARTRILRNSVKYGGDGIFVRAITGRCPTDTWVEGNDTSFSPHFAMETWCEGDTYKDNVSIDSDNGFWLGGGSNIAVVGNRIEGSRVYAMSIMENQGRHILVADNRFENNRAGIMVSGRNRWPGQSMESAGWPNMASSSHIVIQRNTFEGNELADIATSFTRNVVVASNCTGDRDTVVARGPTTESVRAIGHCGEGKVDVPTVKVDAVAPVTLGATQELRAVASAKSGRAISYSWLVQPSAPRFASGALPPALLDTRGTSPSAAVTFSKPGIFDVAVTADDGSVAGIWSSPSFDEPRSRPGWTQIAVAPVGQRVGEGAELWTYACESNATPCSAVVSSVTGVTEVEGAAARLVSDVRGRFSAIVPKTKDLGLRVKPTSTLGFFLHVENPKVWQRTFPEIVLGSGSSRTVYGNVALDSVRQAAGNVLKFGEPDWIYVELPLSGGNGFEIRAGAAPSVVDWISIGVETTPGDPLELTVDAMTFYEGQGER